MSGLVPSTNNRRYHANHKVVVVVVVVTETHKGLFNPLWVSGNNNHGNFICVFECTIVNLATYRQFTNAA